MPFSLSPPVTLPPPAAPGNRIPARSGDNEPGQSGSFGEAMARSREAGRKKASEPAAKPAPSRPLRRPADAEKSPTPDHTDPMTAPPGLLPQSRLAATEAATPGAAAAPTAATATVSASIPVASPVGAATAAAISPAPVDASAAVETGAMGLPGGPAGVVPGNLGNRSSGLAPAPASGPAGTAGMVGAMDPATRASSAPRLAPSGFIAIAIPIGSDSAPAQPRAAPASADMPLAGDPRAAAAQANAAGADLPDPSSSTEMGAASSAAVTSSGLAEASLGASDSTLFAGTGTPVPPAGGALQQPGSLAAPNVSAAQNAPEPAASAPITPEVGSSEWGKALGQQLIHLSAADRQVAELQLNPPGLGPLKVMLSLGDQQMQVAFVSAHSSVRAAVEAALPQLRALLAESGISLGQTSVGAESQPQTGFAHGQDDSGGQPPRPGQQARNAQAAALFAAQPVAVQRRPCQGLQIDTYA